MPCRENSLRSLPFKNRPPRLHVIDSSAFGIRWPAYKWRFENGSCAIGPGAQRDRPLLQTRHGLWSS